MFLHNHQRPPRSRFNPYLPFLVQFFPEGQDLLQDPPKRQE